MRLAKSVCRVYLTALVVAACVSWSAFCLVLSKLDPPLEGASKLGLVLFFISLFFALVASLSLLVYSVRKYVTLQKENALNISIRQGILLSILATSILFFQHLRILNWWSGILLISTIILIEFYFSSAPPE
ncbi:hypothetical protein KKG71_06180 [Patescibacteria group bacterium]|nr:hypothetical protein [Patescibacteria group bacterium]